MVKLVQFLGDADASARTILWQRPRTEDSITEGHANRPELDSDREKARSIGNVSQGTGKAHEESVKGSKPTPPREESLPENENGT
jgi:hypothetical protein